MSKIFITFCGGQRNFHDAANRLYNQVLNLNLFNGMKIYTDKELKNDHIFWGKHQQFIKRNPRGWGCWIWKPYIIKKTIDMMKNGDTLLYLDSGCEVDITKKQRMINCFNYAKRDLIVGSQNCIERRWNKMDLMAEMDIIDDKNLSSKQREAGANMFYINDKTRKFIDKWYELACQYHNIDDSPSKFPNFHNFVEHRHDQSIFSLLSKKTGIYCKEYSINNAVEYIRNRSGKSTLITGSTKFV